MTENLGKAKKKKERKETSRVASDINYVTIFNLNRFETLGNRNISLFILVSDREVVMCNLHVYMYRQDNVFQALNFRLIYSNTLPHEFHKNIVLHHFI